ncbi:PREDICTED: FYVE and coiled-coil domain-containing protein 1-like [Priapulus caudatus]|uniref:FYVE and coiled-coil domain-containing protein 1-like n=1 Tax=Priapulus caudatus TaxID=37621 RepID=A0ABM1EHL3_PRICU|nr:PREDICTED: FYVE and coiled-coil domain-containing protein 1-like [Priapulus caudatus]
MASQASSAPTTRSNKLIEEIIDAVSTLKSEFEESRLPVTDDDSTLHKLEFKLEYLLQLNRKQKFTFLGTQRDYFDYFCECLAKGKRNRDGLKFVKTLTEVKTSVGRGRAFIRYNLMHQMLADTLQLCFSNGRVTINWYFPSSAFLRHRMTASLLTALYDLNEVSFDLAPTGYDLDAGWPTFARKSFGTPYSWNVPLCRSRSTSQSSISSFHSQMSEQHISSPGRPDLSSMERVHMELAKAESVKGVLMSRIEILDRECETVHKMAVEAEEKLEDTKNSLQTQLMESQIRCEKMNNELELRCQHWEEKEHSLVSRLKQLQRENETQQDQLMSLQQSGSGKQGELEEKCRPLELTIVELGVSGKLSEEKVAWHAEREIEKQSGVAEQLQIRLKESEEKNKELLLRMEELVSDKWSAASLHADATDKAHELLTELTVAERSNIQLQCQNLELQRSSVQHQGAPEIDAATPSHTAESRPASSADSSAQTETDGDSAALARENRSLQAALEALRAQREAEARDSSTTLDAARQESDALRTQIDELARQGALEIDAAKMAAGDEAEARRVAEERLEEELVAVRHQIARLRDSEARAAEERRAATGELLRLTDSERHLEEEKASMQAFVIRMMGLLSSSDGGGSGTNTAASGNGRRSLVQKCKHMAADVEALVRRNGELSLQVRGLERGGRELREELALRRERLTEREAENGELETKLRSLVCNTTLPEDAHSITSAGSDARLDPPPGGADEVLEVAQAYDVKRQWDEDLDKGQSENDVVDATMEGATGKGRTSGEEQAAGDEGTVSDEEVVEIGVAIEGTADDEGTAIEGASDEPAEPEEEATVDEAAANEGVAYEGTVEEAAASSVDQEAVEAFMRQIEMLKSQNLSLSEENQSLIGQLDFLSESVASNLEERDDIEQLRGEMSEIRSILSQVSEVSERVLVDVNAETEQEEHLKCVDSREGSAEVQVAVDDQASVASAEFRRVVRDVSEMRSSFESQRALLSELRQQCTTQDDVIKMQEYDIEAKMKRIELVSEEKERLTQKVAEQSDAIKSMEIKFTKKIQETSSAFEEKVCELTQQFKDSQAKVTCLEESLECKTDQLEKTESAYEQDVSALRFQISEENMKYQETIKTYEENDANVTDIQSKLEIQQNIIESMQAVVKEMKDERDAQMESHWDEMEDLRVILEGKSDECETLRVEVTDYRDQLASKEDQLVRLQEDLESVQQSHEAKIKTLQEQNSQLREDSEKLQSTLIKILKDKDTLWQSKDQLEFEQRQRLLDCWVDDKAASHCMGCGKEFSLTRRRHHCRLCGRVFCSACSNHWVLTTASSKKTRTCDRCFMSHSRCEGTTDTSLVGDSSREQSPDSRLEDEASRASSGEASEVSEHEVSMGSPVGAGIEASALLSSSTPQKPAGSSPPEAFGGSESLLHDEDNVQGMSDTGATQTPDPTSSDGDSQLVSAATTASHQIPHNETDAAVSQQADTERSVGVEPVAASSDNTPASSVGSDEQEYAVITTEEVAQSVYDPSYGDIETSIQSSFTLMVDDIIEGRGNEQEGVTVKPRQCFAVPILVEKPGVTLSWEFRTTGHDIGFGVYRDNSTLTMSDAEVLLPVTRCNSHQMAIAGQLKTETMGIYTLLFDNRFSRFTSKKLSYKVEAVK